MPEIQAFVTGCPTQPVEVGDLVELVANVTGAGSNVNYKWERLSPNPFVFPVTTNPTFSFNAAAGNAGQTTSYRVTVCDLDLNVCDESDPCTFDVIAEQDCIFDCVRSQAEFTLSPDNTAIVTGREYTITLPWVDCAGERVTGNIFGLRFETGGVDYSTTFTGNNGVINNYTFTLPLGTPAGAGSFLWGSTLDQPNNICKLDYNIVEGTQDSFLTGCPPAQVSSGTTIDFGIGDAPLGNSARYNLRRISPTAATVLTDVTEQELNDYMFTLTNPNNTPTTFVFEVECCEGVVQLDKIQSVLQQRQPVTGMLSRTGAGQNTTGGTNVVVVSNINDLLGAAFQGGNWVCLAPDFGFQSLGTNWLRVASNTTIDGSDAPGHDIHNPGTRPNAPHTFSNEGGNILIHCINTTSVIQPEDGPGTSLMRTRAEGQFRNFWIDHLEFTGYRRDDGINFGSGVSDELCDDITVSNCKSDSNCFASLATYWQAENHTNGLPGRITVHNNHWRAIFRNPRFDSQRFAHAFNNFIDSPRDSGILCRNRYASNLLARVWSENNYFRNGMNSDVHFQNAFTTDAGNTALYDSGSLVDGVPIASATMSDGSPAQSGNVYNPGDAQYVAPNFPYNYSLLDASQVPTVVSDYAGATFEKDTTVNEGECITARCTITVN